MITLRPNEAGDALVPISLPKPLDLSVPFYFATRVPIFNASKLKTEFAHEWPLHFYQGLRVKEQAAIRSVYFKHEGLISSFIEDEGILKPRMLLLRTFNKKSESLYTFYALTPKQQNNQELRRVILKPDCVNPTSADVLHSAPFIPAYVDDEDNSYTDFATLLYGAKADARQLTAHMNDYHYMWPKRVEDAHDPDTGPNPDWEF